MKKLMTLTLGLAMVLGTTAVVFARQDTKTESTNKKKTKKKKSDTTKKDGGSSTNIH